MILFKTVYHSLKRKGKCLVLLFIPVLKNESLLLLQYMQETCQNGEIENSNVVANLDTIDGNGRVYVRDGNLNLISTFFNLGSSWTGFTLGHWNCPMSWEL